MNQILTCHGLRAGDAEIPPFCVCEGEYVGIALPTDYGPNWTEVMQYLSGQCPSDAIQIAAKAAIVALPGLEPAASELTLTEVAVAQGLARRPAERAISDIGLDPERQYATLQLTPRLMLDLCIAWESGAKLIVFSTAGLDPGGNVTVAKRVLRMVGSGGAINVLSSAIADGYASSGLLNRIVICGTQQRGREL